MSNLMPAIPEVPVFTLMKLPQEIASLPVSMLTDVVTLDMLNASSVPKAVPH